MFGNPRSRGSGRRRPSGSCWKPSGPWPGAADGASSPAPANTTNPNQRRDGPVMGTPQQGSTFGRQGRRRFERFSGHDGTHRSFGGSVRKKLIAYSGEYKRQYDDTGRLL